MALFIDLLFVSLFLFVIIRHYRLGLACSILGAGRFILSLLAAAILFRPVALIIIEASNESSDVSGAAAGVLAFVLVFVILFLASGLLIRIISKIRIPILTRIDKILGLALGFVIGIISLSALATVIYSVIEVIAFINPDSSALTVFDESVVFRFTYGLHVFEFIRNLI